MVEIKKIDYDVLKELVTKVGFDPDQLLKDYYITVLLYLLKDIKGIHFKGGTALQKIFLNYSRLSEDIDFTVTRSILDLKVEIGNAVLKNKVFEKITEDKNVDGFLRLIVHYQNFSGGDEVVFIDLNKRGKLLLQPESHEIIHFYSETIPKFEMQTVAQDEMIAEKVAAAIGRNKPRDHFDIYQIIKKKLFINMKLVEKKCIESNDSFDIIKMFNKAQKLKRHWDEDLMPLITKEITFQEVMTTLAKYFNLKDEKDKVRK